MSQSCGSALTTLIIATCITTELTGKSALVSCFKWVDCYIFHNFDDYFARLVKQNAKHEPKEGPLFRASKYISY